MEDRRKKNSEKTQMNSGDREKISIIELVIGLLTVLLIVVVFLKLAKVLILVTAATLIFLVSYRFFKNSADERNRQDF